MQEQLHIVNESVFRSPEHRRRFVEAMERIDKVEEQRHCDPEYGAAVFILSAYSGIWDRTSTYVSRRGIRFDKMLKDQDFSGGLNVLIRLAGNLFNEHACQVTPVEFTRLDEQNQQLAQNAIWVRLNIRDVDWQEIAK